MTQAPDTMAPAVQTRTVRLVYFAWVRERVGQAEEQVVLPDDVATVLDLVRWLKTRDEGYASAFADETLVRAAVNQTHVKPGASLEGAREIAFFPPMTGG
ncbi:MAG TPA: molybdopterin converting factor subunit 1 [Bosea sp. (in: a-proteobacteria)]|jgi:molybdopterin synthase sulfur carrier subunit|uniref:molybdopterin converting factor subunit 1 n=1 Tax=Bosea sp. (in: a-proteobacteria) TaxID=1871050 RepID=UPI002DDCEEDA|nr:molybdopterin converting factor subunit 1 [Bosea sp. (in: a-proteobacteria)]HEV2552863.1 molybdopterin converting factor subunit 1 [Bosea sp. (in: a-proteobacteria)]